MRVSWAAATHPGARRLTNEDSYCARPDLGLFVVADGMGGHVGGEIASRLAVEAVETFIHDTHTDTNRTWPIPYDPERSPDANRLNAAFVLANRRLGDEVGRDRSLRGMATTASAILLRLPAIIVGHVGDSRVYRFRDGTLERITRDHSWVEEQVRAGILTDRAAREHPWRNVVTRALGGGADPDVDIIMLSAKQGDRLLLCSDGLSSVLIDDRIRSALHSEWSLQVLCEQLVSLANAEGGPDNVTVVTVQIDAS